MTAILGWIAAGKLEAPKVTTYPFEKVADAQRAIESGETTGKLVLVV
jgi:NADPH:quinone reductase-like Zn-dependent oxidoreductase